MFLLLSVGSQPDTRTPPATWWVSALGRHAALLAATLPGVEHAFDFYGEGVSRMRPGGGEPSLALLPESQARQTCVFGVADPLIPSEDREAI